MEDRPRAEERVGSNCPDVVGSRSPDVQEIVLTRRSFEGLPGGPVPVKDGTSVADCPYVIGARSPDSVQRVALRQWVLPAPSLLAKSLGRCGRRDQGKTQPDPPGHAMKKTPGKLSVGHRSAPLPVSDKPVYSHWIHVKVTELVTVDDLDQHLAIVGQAQVNAHLLVEFLAASSLRPTPP